MGIAPWTGDGGWDCGYNGSVVARLDEGAWLAAVPLSVFLTWLSDMAG